MSDFITNTDNAYIKLEENIDDFENEVRLIDEAKCYLINFDSLDGFTYEDAEIEDSGIGYNIYYNDRVYLIETREGMILNYDIK